jgi:hypothetical protein
METLTRTRPSERIAVVDSDPDALTGMENSGAQTLVADGTEFLVRQMTSPQAPEWIIPCVPFHLAFRWLQARLGRQVETVPLPPAVSAGLPHPHPAEQGGFYISYADFTCPPHCPEPADVCTFTGAPRIGILYADLGKREWAGFRPAVLRSRQLAPGLGGYRPRDLIDLERQVRRASGPILVATACKCHGVVHGLRVK